MNDSTKANLSKWMRSAVSNCDRIEDGILSLQSFFRDMEAKFSSIVPVAGETGTNNRLGGRTSVAVKSVNATSLGQTGVSRSKDKSTDVKSRSIVALFARCRSSGIAAAAASKHPSPMSFQDPPAIEGKLASYSPPYSLCICTFKYCITDNS